MSDIYDRATDREEKDRELALKYRKPTVIPCGACHYCGEPLPAGMLFCPPIIEGSCRDDWEREQAAKIRNGK